MSEELRGSYVSLETINQMLQEENARLREALLFYADSKSWSDRYMRQGTMVKMPKKKLYVDGGTKASNALELNQ